MARLSTRFYSRIKVQLPASPHPITFRMGRLWLTCQVSGVTLAAKQDAFEESIRLKNQFRSLDEDEVEFLDSVLESTRAKEAEVKKDTREQLEMFRRQREEADKAVLDQGEGGLATALVDDEQWGTTAKKRKRPREPEGFKGLKLRKSSSAGEPIEHSKTTLDNKVRTEGRTQKQPDKHAESNESKSQTPTTLVTNPTTSLGLGNYASDDESDDE